MRKNRVLITLGVIVLMVASCPLAYSLIVAHILKKTFSKEIDIGPVTFSPGKQQSDGIGLFEAYLDMEDSRLKLNKSTLEIPNLSIKVKLNEITVLAPNAHGKVVELDHSDLNVKGLSAQATLRDLQGKKINAKIGIERMELSDKATSVAVLEWIVSLKKERHNHWDMLSADITAVTMESASGESAQLDKLHFHHTQNPRNNNRLVTKNRIGFEKFLFEVPKENIRLIQENLDFEIDIEIAGDRGTNLFFTLSDTIRKNPGAHALSSLILQHDLKIERLGFNTGKQESRIDTIRTSYRDFELAANSVATGDFRNFQVTAKLQELDIQIETVGLKIAEVGLESKSYYNEKHSEELSRIIRSPDSTITMENLAKAVDPLLKALDESYGEFRLHINDTVLIANGKETGFPETGIFIDFLAKKGIVNCSITTSLFGEKLKNIPPPFPQGIPFDSLESDVKISQENFDLKAFKELAENLNQSDQKTIISMANKAFQKFVNSKPTLKFDFRSNVDKTGNISFKTEYRLSPPLATDFSIQGFLTGRRQDMERPIIQLVKASHLNLDINIENRKKMEKILAGKLGQGIGQSVYELVTQVFVKDGKGIKMKLIIQNDQVKINGQPNPRLNDILGGLLR
ncbi:MAG: YdgA family protein [Proteobacteria bacterium]|nr:YdgA family protein [Pseudomonadota bacterium]